jgi:hypothetical protein
MTGFRRVPPWVAASGLLILVLGTFLPWFHSRSVERHSYQAADSAGRLGLFDNAFVHAALQIWLAVPLVCTVCLGLFALGLSRSGPTVTTVLAISAGTVALLVTVRSGGEGGLIGITPAGPATTLTGASLALAGALGTLVIRAGRSHPPRTTRTGDHP